MKKRTSKTQKNWQFSKGVNPWFWSKNCHFSNFYFLENICQENVFYDILERKNVVLDYKNKKFKKSKNWHFFKGVNPWFWSKNGHFSNFHLLGNTGQENVFYDILERKNAFLAYKKKKFKQSKSSQFSRRVTDGFGPKMAIIPTSFFRQSSQGKCLLRYSRRKKSSFRLQKQEGQTLAKSPFFQRVNAWFWSKNGHFCNFYFLWKTGQENVFYDIPEQKKRLSSV